MESLFTALGVRRPSLRPLLGRHVPGKKHRWLRIVALVMLTLTCLISLHALSDGGMAMSFATDSLRSTYSNATTMTVVKVQKESSPSPSKDEEAIIEVESCDSIKARADSLPDIDWWYPAESISDVQLAGWEDDWIAHGIIKQDSQIDPYKVDFVYTYVRSDEDFINMKKPFDATNKQASNLRWQILQASRFRSWDELRYSIRGSVKNAASWISRINIVAKDFTRHDEELNKTTHVIQTPPWLTETFLESNSQIRVVPETSILRNGDCGPTFNSVSVESSFGNVPLSTDHFIGLSDDMFLGKPASASDFVSPLFGMSFSWYKDIWAVDETHEPDLGDGELGEAHPARHSSFLLNGRFGRRPRSLQLHHAKIVNQKILNEAMQTFPKSALQTPLSRWRDDAQQLYSWYLHMHYTMEMHRESLLWSIAMRIDTNEDDELQPEERSKFLQEIDEGIKNHGRRHDMPMLGQMQQKFSDASLEGHKIQKAIHTSLDGPQQIKYLTFDQCNTTFSVDKCFGAAFSDYNENYSMTAFFERLAAPELGVECGDCLIKYLLNNADMGLSPLLPAAGGKYRERAIKAIHKFQYTETSPDNSFLMVRNVADAHALPGYADRAPGLMCINDDITTMDPHQLGLIANGYHDFFEKLFPEPTIFEKDITSGSDSQASLDVSMTGAGDTPRTQNGQTVADEAKRRARVRGPTRQGTPTGLGH